MGRRPPVIFSGLKLLSALQAGIGRLGVVLAAGAILPFAFAPYGYHPLALPCLGVLFWSWDGAGRKEAVIVGALFGLGMFAHGVSWIQVSIHQFGMPLYSFSVAVTAAFVLFMCVYPALCGYIVSSFPAPHRLARILFLCPVAWTVTEVLRGSLFTGFPWLLVGYSQVDSPIAAFAPLVGVYGVSFVAALVAAGLLVLWRGDAVWRSAAAAILGGVVVATIVLDTVGWTSSIGKGRRVALIQGAIPQAVKWSGAYRQPTVELYTHLSEPHWGKSMIVWPETAIPAFPQEVPETIAELNARAKRSGTTLLVGMPTGDRSDGGVYFNSVVQFGTDRGQYDKRHLVPFGEYLPFDSWMRPLTTFLRIPMSNFSAGAMEQPPLSANGYAIGVSICYEDAYAGEVARALPPANVLVNVSNDAWFGDSIAPHQHLQIARMRALESGRYLLRATNTGISAIIDHRGEIVADSQQFVADVVSGEMVPRAGSTPAVKYGATLIVSLCITVLLTFAIAGTWRRRPTGS